MSSHAAGQGKRRSAGRASQVDAETSARPTAASKVSHAKATTSTATAAPTFNVPASSSPHDMTIAPESHLSGAGEEAKPRKKRRGGKKHKRDQRDSFAIPSEPQGAASGMEDDEPPRPSLANIAEQRSHEARESFYRLGRGAGSSTSLESQALLDHREHGPLQTRRASFAQGLIPGRLAQQSPRTSQTNVRSNVYSAQNSSSRLPRPTRIIEGAAQGTDERSPLISSSFKTKYGTGYSKSPKVERGSPFNFRRASSSRSSRQASRFQDDVDDHEEYDVNNPPSMPGSPKFGADMGLDDVMLTGSDIDQDRSSQQFGELLIDIGENAPIDRLAGQTIELEASGEYRRRLQSTAAEDDVCFPHDDVTDIGEEDAHSDVDRRRRRRRREWPDLSILEDWAVEEKEQRTLDKIRMRQVSEPVMVNGRLRPTKQPWHREVEEQPMRFTYFNEDFESTLHSESLSELLHDGRTFRNLFIPDPPLLSDSESESDNEQRFKRESGMRQTMVLSPKPKNRPHSVAGTNRTNSRLDNERRPTPQPSTNNLGSNSNSGHGTGTSTPSPGQQDQEKRYGQRPIWWLDVLCPTEAEMKVMSKAFGIHPLTAEDVMVQEQREKVELFRNYYFVTYRSFEQDSNSEDYMDPVSMYVVVFRDGVISFHFSQTPHPANVRRRIRQLSDYLVLTTDWISYAIIDDVTDSYAPLIERIEEEVDDVDEAILRMHAAEEDENRKDEHLHKPCTKEKTFLGRRFPGLGGSDKQSEHGLDETMQAGDMIRTVGECRKKVMTLYRLLGNKADVIKGFAKRCNEQWNIAPRSDIGLYLGDIQDHIITMTGNLSHYENLLSRAHSNYLAQINIRMNERAEKTNDVLGKLTVLGTIVLPMNIVTGLWGMNCLVPGQDVDSLTWFWCLTAGLVVFGTTCYFIAKRAYGIV